MRHFAATRPNTRSHAIVTTIASRKGMTYSMALVGYVEVQNRHDAAGHLGEPAIGFRLAASRRQTGDHSHERPVGSVAGQRIPEQIPFDGKLVGDHPAALFEPVIDQLALNTE